MKQKYILTILLFLVAIANYGQTDKNSILRFMVDSSSTKSLSYHLTVKENYFPSAIRIDSNNCVGLDKFRNDWYSKHLRAMNEPILYNRRIKKEVFRFTWLRSFHNPIIVRIEKINDSILLYYKMTNGAGGYEPGKIIIDSRKVLAVNNWIEFVSLLNSAKFWDILPCKMIFEGLDGAQWILEGANKDYYQVIDKWSPDRGIYYDCCNYLLELTGLKINKKDKY